MTKAYTAAGATVTISATTTSGSSAIMANANAVRLLNIGTVATHVAFGGSSIAATTADLALGPNEALVLDKAGAGYIAARTASGTATLYVTPVE